MSFRGGNAVDVGECIFLPDQNNPIINMNNGAQSYLKSGNLLINQDATYPDVYSKFTTLVPSFTNWVNKSVPYVNSQSITINKIFYVNNSYFIVVIVDSNIYKLYTTTSLDLNFTEVVLPTNSLINDMTYAYGLYIIVTDDGFLYTGQNLTTWTSRTISTFTGTGNSIIRIIFTGTYLVSVCRYSTNTTTVARSLDGINWIVSSGFGTFFATDMTYDLSSDRVFIIGTNSKLSAGNLYQNIAIGYSGAFQSYQCVTGGNGLSGYAYSLVYHPIIDRLILLCNINGNNYIYMNDSKVSASYNTVTNQNLSITSDFRYRNAFYANGYVFAFNSSNQLAYSSNGNVWTLITSSPQGFSFYRSMIYGKNEYVMAGNVDNLNKLSSSIDNKTLGFNNKILDTDGISVLYTRIK